jgi:endonuclease/exonuclease/phosphatase family metal-dependent hydrolase
MDRQRSESRIAEVIASMSADVVGLQELDSGRKRSAAVDQAAVIAAQLGWKARVSSRDAPRRRAIRRRDHQPLSAHVEARGGAARQRHLVLPRETRRSPREAETALGPVHIINSHFGLGRGERIAQALLLISADWFGSFAADAPLVLLGDLTASAPRARTASSPSTCAMFAHLLGRPAPSAPSRPRSRHSPSITSS